MPSDSTGVIAERYALALFELAQTQGSLAIVAGDLSSLESALHESEEFRRVLKGHNLPRATQTKAVLAVAQAAQLSQLTTNFLGVLGESRRLDALSAIIASFNARLAKSAGEVSAQVVTATALSQEQLSKIGAALHVAFGGKVTFTVAEDPSLLGGLVVKVGSRMVDSSVKSKLQNLKLAMKGVG